MNKYTKLLDKFCYSLIEDLISWRNKLLVAIIILCFVTVRDAITFGIATGLLGVIIPYYFHLRQKSQDNGFKTSDFNGKE